MVTRAGIIFMTVSCGEGGGQGSTRLYLARGKQRHNSYVLRANRQRYCHIWTLYSQKIEMCRITGRDGPAIVSPAACLLPLHHPYSMPGCGGTLGGERAMDWKTLLAYITGSVD